MERVLTVPEAADYLRQSVYTVRAWIREGKLRAKRVGRSYLITESAVTELVAPPERKKLGTKESLARMYELMEESRRAGLGPDNFKQAMREEEARERASDEEMWRRFSSGGSA